jgi:ABC-type multidrug transport system fused ATPase/permease subunit
LGVVFLVGWINLWSFIPALISLVGLLFVRYRFAPGSRDLKRLEGITRSPVYSHLSSTIHGLNVVRSYYAEDVCSADFLSRLNDNTRTNHLIIETNRWAAIRFDWVALIFIGLVMLLAMALRVTGYHHFSPVQIALILSNSISLMSLLQWTIR